jgi:RNA polymerase sigma factor (sigma-70 family)
MYEEVHPGTLFFWTGRFPGLPENDLPMPAPTSEKLPPPLKLILGAGSAVGYSDSQLLDLLIRGRDGAKDLAFRALLDRHGSMVWGVCRQLLCHAPDADDAFQATFLVLIHKAGSLKVTGSLGPWLYQVAWRVAHQARSDRRKERSGTVGQLEDVEQPEHRPSVSPEHLAALHGELNRLPARYRLPIVLCHLEGKTHEEAARALCWPVGTVSGRLSRGRSLLRSRLERRGWKTPEDLIGTVIPAGHALRVPARLIDHCVRAVDGFASPDVAGGKAYELMKGALRSMFWNQMKAGAAALVVVVSLAGTAGMLSRGSLALALGGGSERPGLPRANPPSQQTEKSRDVLSGPTLELAALDPQAGAGNQPAPAARRRAAETPDDVTVENAPPVVVKTVPRSGDTEVDPNLHEVQVTFSKEMLDKSWSWVTASKNTFPDANGDIRYLDDRLTCVLHVKLKPGRTYATWINSGRFTNFLDRDRRPAVPYLLVFRTRP